ncbi:MAG: DNA recombination protein RmuC, partial [Candidatus Micrarchaeaceae archaeon]
DEFKTRVETVYSEETRDRSTLVQQVRQLIELNQRLSDEANSLTEALKGSTKTLGNWGEMILERILECSGLRKGDEYLIRPTYTREDGRRAQPDAVVYLPESRNLIIDSKASLDAHDRYVRAGSDPMKAEALADLTASLRRHLNDLSISEYQALPGLNSPDFVVMFVPIESAFIVAITHDTKLWEDAWNKNVLLVSPTSLLFVIRVVYNLWTQEAQRKGFQDIARRGASLYDKFAGFVEDLKGIGERLADAREKYDSALSKLYTGKGNVIRQAEMLKELGVRPSKSLPPELVELGSDTAVVPDTSAGALPLETAD